MPKSYLTEDWTVVLLGFLLIGAALLGLPLPAPAFGWKTLSELSSNVLTGANLDATFFLLAVVWVVAALGAWLTGRNVRATLLGLPVIFLITWLALLVAGQGQIKALGLEAVIFSLLFGLLLRNVVGLPDWLRDALATELYVKIGLVLLGTGVIFGDILKAGALGLVQALVVVVSVWYVAYWLCKRLKVDDELTMMLASGVSICGVSAAIATAGAINGDPKKLSYVISLVLITAIPMMLGMPWVAHWLGLSDAVTGAWLGGTIDTTGAVVASGTLAGDEALKISTIVKFAQNVLLGLAALAISVYWTYQKREGAEKPTAGVIWQRFPKFVLGFLGASLLFSFGLSPEKIDAVKGGLKNLQGVWFALAFTSIGLETDLRDFAAGSNPRPLWAFLGAQVFNVLITLGMALWLFS